MAKKSKKSARRPKNFAVIAYNYPGNKYTQHSVIPQKEAINEIKARARTGFINFRMAENVKLKKVRVKTTIDVVELS